MSALRVHAVMTSSRANGPGERLAVWTQGCGLACPGCQNPDTWDARAGQLVPIAQLLHQYRSRPYRGLSLSGGEPFEQAEAAAELAEGVRALGGDVVVFTGHSLSRLRSQAGAYRLLAATDLLIDGRWIAARAIEGRPLRASANQEAHELSGRIRRDELDQVPPVEWVGGEDGATLSGLWASRFATLLGRA